MELRAAEHRARESTENTRRASDLNPSYLSIAYSRGGVKPARCLHHRKIVIPRGGSNRIHAVIVIDDNLDSYLWIESCREIASMAVCKLNMFTITKS